VLDAEYILSCSVIVKDIYTSRITTRNSTFLIKLLQYMNYHESIMTYDEDNNNTMRYKNLSYMTVDCQNDKSNNNNECLSDPCLIY
jgi:hypothetical protein